MPTCCVSDGPQYGFPQMCRECRSYLTSCDTLGTSCSNNLFVINKKCRQLTSSSSTIVISLTSMYYVVQPGEKYRILYNHLLLCSNRFSLKSVTQTSD